MRRVERFPFRAAPIVPDIGIFASGLVAINNYDFVNVRQDFIDSLLFNPSGETVGHVYGVYMQTDGKRHLEQIGTTNYALIDL